MKLDIGSYGLILDPEETGRGYGALPPYGGESLAVRFFHHLLPRAKKESLEFLRGLGVDPAKITAARPLAEPDENGEVLYLCAARLCGRLIRGGDTVPRQSEEHAGLSLVFEAGETCPGPSPFSWEEEVEMRFVIPLPFDGEFFAGL